MSAEFVFLASFVAFGTGRDRICLNAPIERLILTASPLSVRFRPLVELIVEIQQDGILLFLRL